MNPRKQNQKMFNAVSVLRLLFYFFQETYVWKINFLEPAKIKKMNDDWNADCKQRKKKRWIYKSHDQRKTNLYEYTNSRIKYLIIIAIAFYIFRREILLFLSTPA